MIQVNLYSLEEIKENFIGWAVIASSYRKQWVFAKHKERTTWEIPGGRREVGEKIIETAHRELKEETGAISYTLTPIRVYGVKSPNEQESYGLLAYAQIETLGPLPPLEIEKIGFFDTLPQHLTYPHIQSKLMETVKDYLSQKS